MKSSNKVSNVVIANAIFFPDRKHDNPYDFPSQEICTYYSWKLVYGEKLVVISDYPFQ